MALIGGPVLTLHFHPLSSFCMKALLGLYELDVPFEKRIVDLGNAAERAAFVAVWPLGKFPVLRDEARGLTIPESTILLEHVDRAGRLIPAEPDAARDCRLRDRFFDLYVNVPMAKIVTDKLRPEGRADSHGVEKARAELETAYGIADTWLGATPWAAGDTFTLADCAAAPALYYAGRVQPFGRRKNLAAYLERIASRPSYVRVMEEAAPYMAMFPG